MNLPLNKRCAEMLTSVSAIFMPFWLPLKKQPLLWRGERCVAHFLFFLLSLIRKGREAVSWPEVTSWRADFRTGSLKP